MKRVIIPVGPFHPIQEEPEFFKITVEGERVVDMDVRISYSHRGMEKLCEDLTYDQIPLLLARICGICSASHPMAFCQALEDLCGVEVPVRARYIRSIICEMERIHSHMLWVGLAGHFIGYNTVFMWAWKYREPVLDWFERAFGNRNHYENFCVGGCRRDLPEEEVKPLRKLLDELEPKVEMLTNAVLDDPVLGVRLRGIGVLSKEDARQWCTAGPTVRGSGLYIDVRADEPYAAYDLVDWKVMTQEAGDAFSKAVVRLLETLEAVQIIRRCLDQIEPGPIRNEVREMPKGEGIGRAEAPRGETFHYVCSNGTNYPERYKVRAPTYMNLPSFKAQVIGEELADAMLIVAAMDPCYSCTERAAVVERGRSGERHLRQEELLRMSWAKTERIRRQV